MARFVMANRRAGKFVETEKTASRAALASGLSRLAPGIRIERDNAPAREVDRRVVVFDGDATEVEARRAELGPDVIIEPEILHRPSPNRPIDLLRVGRISPAAATAAETGRVVEVVLSGDGQPVRGAEVTVFARFGGFSEGFTGVTDTDGRIAIGVPQPFGLSALVVVPPGGFWSKVVRGPEFGRHDIALQPLPDDGPYGWWHRVTFSADGDGDGDGGGGVRVGVVDTGTGPHPALDHAHDVGAFVGGHDPSGGADADSHGTHVAGTIGGRAIGVAHGYVGVAPSAELFTARVFPPGRGANQADIVDAIDRLSMVDQVDLINLSLGADQASEIERDAITDAFERGTLCICAAGNDDGPVLFPAAFRDTVAVSALGRLGVAPPDSLSGLRLPGTPDRFGEFSLYLANFSCFGTEITCGAPGVGVIAPVPERFGLNAPYAAMDGTSMACPMTTGVLARLLAADSVYGSLSRAAIRAERALTVLRNACVDLGIDARFQGRGLPRVPPQIS